MENNFNNRDFEQFVKQNADQYRMFPSEKVWDGIHNTLHTRKRWYGIGLVLLLLTAGTVTWVMLNNSAKNESLSYKSITPSQNNVADKKNKDPEIIIAVTRPSKNSISFITTADKLQKSLFLPNPGISNNDEENTTASVLATTKEPLISSLISTQPEETVIKTAAVYSKQNVLYKPATMAVVKQVKSNDSVFTENKKAVVIANRINFKEEKKENYPLTIESVINSYKHQRARKRLSWEVYFSPTISYRKLKENKSFINSATRSNNNTVSYTAVTDINSLVTHKPDVGLQFGFTAGYPLSKSLKIIAGLQLNVSKYDIKAYSYPSEVATIALNTSGSNNSVSTITNYRNFSGYNANWLHNLYISASLPIGLELKLIGNKKTHLGIGSTVQPTYVLGDRAYLISTDYKNYATVPSLTRKWNVSTDFEIFAGYSTGKIRWRVGPEIRYQLMSSFQEKYPVKEHLFDFGLKMGLMLNK